MTHLYRATVDWERGSGAFTDGRYTRGHRWLFDGGVEVPASSSPASVPLPLSREDAVDPEEAFVAAVSSCHMLFFLAFAAKGGFVVERYRDEAVCLMTRDANGRLHISSVTLDPTVTFAGDRIPSLPDLAGLHHRAHAECYIANSITAEVTVLGSMEAG